MGFQHIFKTANYSDDVIIIDNSTLLQIQKQLLWMMDDIVNVFEKEKIRWFLSGGSILGAVRHKGFIPWDDDIDIFLEREEYEKLRKVFETELGEKYELKNPGDKDYLMHYPRIQKKGTKIQSIQSIENHSHGLFIDIFVLENTYDNWFLRNLHGLRSTFLLFVDSSVRLSACSANILKYTNNNPQIRKEVKKRTAISRLFKFRSLEHWLACSDNVFSSVKKRGKYLVCPGGVKHFFGELYNSTMFERPVKMCFENRNWNVPVDPDMYLKIRYGDNYMEIPPVEKRERHAYVVLELGKTDESEDLV